MKKILLLTLSAVFAFAINFNTASKEELMALKGIGAKKAEAIMKYRKKNKINGIKDLVNVKGIGSGIAGKITGNKAIKKMKAKKENIKSKISKKKEDSVSTKYSPLVEEIKDELRALAERQKIGRRKLRFRL